MNNNIKNYNKNKNNNKIVIDLETEDLIRKAPKRSKIILSNNIFDKDHFIKRVELSIYITKHHKTLGEYSILVVVIETNKGTVIMKYDEGYRGQYAFEDAVELITKFSGLSSLINRALIELNKS